jgi:DNA invertase Pin-like site-specific DNA recombinase
MNAIYVRTSTDDNDGAAQIHELRQWAEREGLKNVQEFIDRGESGTKESRPAWDRLRDMVRAGRIHAVAATEIARLGRSVLPVVLALDEMHRAGCRVVLLRQGLDYGTPIGRAVATILVAIAQLERDQIRERLAAGMRRAKEKGTRSGKPIGRPRAVIDQSALNQARTLRKRGLSWANVQALTHIPAGTLRRALAACQNPV